MADTSPRTLPYGSWPSPVSAAGLAAAVVGLNYGVADGDAVLWTEAHPEQGGRVGLWRQVGDAAPEEIVTDANVRTRINEYGGGAWTAADGWVVHSVLPSGDLWVITPDGTRRRLAPAGTLRYGSLAIDPGRRLVLAVREDHTDSDAACVQTVVALDLDGENLDGGRVLVHGADFYASPTTSADGRLAWVQWQLPAMPWDATELWTAPLADPSAATRVAGGPGTSVVYPTWLPDGALVYLSDISGYWNFRRWDGVDDRAVAEFPFDFCEPLWVPDPAPYTVLVDGRIGCTWLQDGYARLGLLAPSGELTEIPTDAVRVALSGTGDRVVAVCGYADRPAELRLLDLAAGTDRLLRRASEDRLPPEAISIARPITWDSPDGPVHAWYYPPASADHRAPAGDLPPVQVWSHGGPTGFSGPDYRPATQFWTSRGIGILDVNYSGSGGYGRAYRDRLQGRWGLSDVRDCVGCVRALVDAGLADPARLSIRGGSAGGFTTLAALTTTDVFAAGISLYGIGDLEALATDTHKFESRYLDGLVAPYPQGRQTYLDRSPLHHLDRLSCPMLILQGADDRVVPPNQAEAMAAAVREKGLVAELVVFEGEGHGFRRAENIVATAELALAFLGRVHGFTPAP
ncbi:MAG: prolyl oligopeptidase family serine peptidase [Propionicimonas sp.]|uniref:S9 family peptidase n=1 Tax=Propionicimonas sp. TaxID=1955623 RepID=UPI003D147F72